MYKNVFPFALQGQIHGGGGALDSLQKFLVYIPRSRYCNRAVTLMKQSQYYSSV